MGSKAYELSEINQPVWEKFQAKRLAEILEKQAEKGEVNEKSAKINIAQYKEGAILLNSICKDFSKLTAKQIEQAKEIKPQKAGCINGFLLACVESEFVKLTRPSMMALIPVEYRFIAEKLLRA